MQEPSEETSMEEEPSTEEASSMQDLEDTQEDLSTSICCCFRWCLHQMISDVTISKPKNKCAFEMCFLLL